MSNYKDTLTLYDELIEAGTPEAQARAQAKQLGEIGTVLDAMNVKLDKIDKDLIWMRVIGAAMIVAFLSNAWFK